MKFLRFLKSKTFFKHISLMIIVSVVLIWLTMKFLDIYTHHGESVTVPDYTGLYVDELEEYRQDDNFRFEISDSVHDATKEKGTIVTQVPLPNSNVKKNRKIYLTIIASSPEKVSMPNLKDITLRQAVAVLETYGLKLGNKEFVPDLGETIMKQKYKGKIIKEGDEIPKGSEIDLVIGKGLGKVKVSVPQLVGKKRREVVSILNESSLNIGAEMFDNKDTVNVRVYKQRPSRNDMVRAGSTVDLWYQSEDKFDDKD